MSDFLAIGGASETLRALLEDRMELPQAMGNLNVSIGAPKPVPAQNPPTPESARVNIFLYRVSESAALKNQEIPGRAASSGYGAPPLSLELFYLLTGHGSTGEPANLDETPGQILLGSAMRTLHDFPVITDALTSRRPPLGEQILHESLRGEYEKLKITLDPVSLEDLSKVWTALTIPFRVSAAYHVSLVQIESRRPRTFSQRVQRPPASGPRLHVFPFRYPHIERIVVILQDDPTATEQPYPYARVLDRIILEGENLGGLQTIVRIGTLDLVLGITREKRIEFIVPDNALPTGVPISPEERLQPGPQLVSVRNFQPATPGGGFPSNQAVFMLRPRAINATLQPGRVVRITGTRLFNRRLSGETVIGRAVIPRIAYVAGATDIQIDVPVPNAVVAWHVQGLTTPAPAFPLPATPPLDVLPMAFQFTIGADGPRTARIPRRPADLQEFARLLENAIRGATDAVGQQGGPGFAMARVTTARTPDRLIIVPGEYAAAVTIANDPVATALGMGAGGPQAIEIFLSGELAPFPEITSSAPRVRLRIGPDSHDLTLANRPVSLGEAAALLETAIRGFPEAAFVGAAVAPLDRQLAFLFPGAAAMAVRFEPIPGIDELTALELDLVGDVGVRVRVNGAETLERISVNLTT